MKLKIVFLCMALILLASIVNASENSVSVGGHTFTTDLPNGWVLSSDSNEPSAFDSSNPDNAPDGANAIGTWKGTEASLFDFLGYPNAPKGNSQYGVITGFVAVDVLKIPDELKQSIQDKDIAVYGSLDKVPDDRKAQDLQDILGNAVYVTRIGDEKFDSDKAITFSGHDARLFEIDGNAISIGMLAISLDPNTVAVIYASINKEHLSGQEDATLYDGRAWDIIDSITVN